jgi:hypothetical protein
MNKDWQIAHGLWYQAGAIARPMTALVKYESGVENTVNQTS